MLIQKTFCLNNYLIVKCIFVLQKAKKKKIDKKTPGDLGVDISKKRKLPEEVYVS